MFIDFENSRCVNNAPTRMFNVAIVMTIWLDIECINVKVYGADTLYSRYH